MNKIVSVGKIGSLQYAYGKGLSGRACIAEFLIFLKLKDGSRYHISKRTNGLNIPAPSTFSKKKV